MYTEVSYSIIQQTSLFNLTHLCIIFKRLKNLISMHPEQLSAKYFFFLVASDLQFLRNQTVDIREYLLKHFPPHNM